MRETQPSTLYALTGGEGGGLGGMSVPSISHSSSGYDTIQSPSRRGVKTTTRIGNMTKLPLLLWHKITTEKMEKTHHV